MVIGEGGGLTSGGVGLGLAIALAVAPLVRSELFGISALDPVTIAAVPALLVVVVAVACHLPARRATAIDPATALRA